MVTLSPTPVSRPQGRPIPTRSTPIASSSHLQRSPLAPPPRSDRSAASSGAQYADAAGPTADQREMQLVANIEFNRCERRASLPLEDHDATPLPAAWRACSGDAVRPGRLVECYRPMRFNASRLRREISNPLPSRDPSSTTYHSTGCCVSQSWKMVCQSSLPSPITESGGPP